MLLDEEVARLNIFAVRMRRMAGTGHTLSLSFLGNVAWCLIFAEP